MNCTGKGDESMVPNKRILVVAVGCGFVAIMAYVLFVKRQCIMTTREDPICPASCFYLDPSSVTNLEKDALLMANAEAAERLSCYYSLYKGESEISDLWKYRLAQIGGFQAAAFLKEKGVLQDPKSIFTDCVIEEMEKSLMSDLAKSYICYQYRSSRAGCDASLDDYISGMRDLAAKPAEVVVRRVNGVGAPEQSKFEYYAYKSRLGPSLSENSAQYEVVVFPQLPAPYHEMWTRTADGIACQNAVAMAEDLGLAWIVVAIAPFGELVCKTAGEGNEWFLRLSDDECLRCVNYVLKDVFLHFSLPQTTSVMFAGNVEFVNRMTGSGCNGLVIKRAPTCLVTKFRDKDGRIVL